MNALKALEIYFQIVFQKVCINIHSHWQYTSVPSTPSTANLNLNKLGNKKLLNAFYFDADAETFLAVPAGAPAFPIQRTCLVRTLSFPQMMSFILTRTLFLWHMNLPQPVTQPKVAQALNGQSNLRMPALLDQFQGQQKEKVLM